MKDVFLIYNTSCFYEIVILNYFMSLTKCDMLFCSLDGKPIKVTEGFSEVLLFREEIFLK